MASQNKSKYNCRGTGIGLTISKKLVESLGGRISLTSQINKGTIVTFTVQEYKSLKNSFEENKSIFNSISPSYPNQSSWIVSSDFWTLNKIPQFSIKRNILSSRK